MGTFLRQARRLGQNCLTPMSAAIALAAPLWLFGAEAKVISKSNLESFLSRTGLRDRESVESLGTRLIRDRVVEARPIAQILSRRIHAALTEISSWPEGPFSFHASSEASGEPAIFFNLQDVVGELLRAGSDRRQGGQRPAR